ncbi:MAG TPA: tRNA epoxyqueuosine(34) reductase QueG [Nitrospira sp.]|nr:tRNA epoxyqueuosine(34) reductase QueG [Nitrospira sp.]
MSLSETIKREARALGFDAVGIATVDCILPATLLQRLHVWLANQYHGTMAWMARPPSRRADPGLVLPGCRSIVSVAMTYNTDLGPNEGPGYGRIARYAWGKDYHLVLGERLRQLEEKIKLIRPDAATRLYVDTGPVMEKAWAQQAGIGWIGKHSNLVSSDHGSWLLLGEILTTLELGADEPATDLCGTCTLCIKACPTGAIVEPYVVDARRCISYVTIEHRGPEESIPDELKSQMANHIFGCDDCLDVCPFNLRVVAQADASFFPAEETRAPVLKDLAEMTREQFVRRFKDSPISRAKWEGLRRNVSIAQANEARQHKAASPLSSLAK